MRIDALLGRPLTSEHDPRRSAQRGLGNYLFYETKRLAEKEKAGEDVTHSSRPKR